MMFKKTLMALSSAVAAVSALGGDFPEDLNGPSKNDKIAIIGAGPAGVHMAQKLHNMGYTKIKVFESEDEVGGKTKPFSAREDSEDVPEDVGLDAGAIYIPGESVYGSFHSLLRETGFDQELVTADFSLIHDPFVAIGLGIPLDTPIQFTEWLSVRALGTSAPSAVAHFMQQYVAFCVAHAAFGCQVPEDPTQPNPADPFFASYGKAYFATSIAAYSGAVQIQLATDARFRDHGLPAFNENNMDFFNTPIAQYINTPLDILSPIAKAQAAAYARTITNTFLPEGFPIEVASLSFMRPVFEAYFLLQGYGKLEETSMFYGATFITPQFATLLGQRASGAPLPPNQNNALLKSGVGAVFQHVAEELEEEGVKFKMSRTVKKIVKRRGGRNRGRYAIWSKRTNKPWWHRRSRIRVDYADFVISAIDQRIFAKLLKNVPQTKSALRAATDCIQTTTWRVSDADVTVNPAAFTSSSIYSWSQANDFARNAGLPLPDIESNVAVVNQAGIKQGFTFEDYANPSYTRRPSVLYELAPETEVEDITFEKLGVNHIETIYETIEHDYFPHSQDLSECSPWDILPLQGQDNIWYIGSSVSFESVESVMDYNNLLISTFAPA